jgi:hypothetical protein
MQLQWSLISLINVCENYIWLGGELLLKNVDRKYEELVVLAVPLNNSTTV